MKMVPEIKVLGKKFTGKAWNKQTQEDFINVLIEEKIYEGTGPKDLAYAGRDRINRGPKSLGFVKLKPTIELTKAGEMLINSKRKEEVLLRQLLKFQLPSPYHIKSRIEENKFHVKPYLEMFRLIRTFGALTFDEVMLFGLQLIDYRDFDNIVEKIENFRIDKAKRTESYRNFRGKILRQVVLELFREDVKAGKTKLRESEDSSIKNFVQTKSRTMRDYTDACFRYLRATGLTSISNRNRSISVRKEKVKEVDFVLETIGRIPEFVNNLEEYQNYLFNPELPVLYTDDRDNLLQQIYETDVRINRNILDTLSVIELKEFLYKILEEKKEKALKSEIKKIKDYESYDDIVNVYRDIKNKHLYDLPLMLEWNTWRAMTMLDGGNIKANLKFDDSGEPMTTAIGNQADIVCDYGKFGLTVEVTLSSGARQYEMEGEPVARHLANFKKEINKDAYCLFIAPSINEACISHFYVLHKVNIEYYGGKSVIVPLELSTFEKMVEDSFKADYIPSPENVESFFKYSEEAAKCAESETEWFNKVSEKALKWLA